MLKYQWQEVGKVCWELSGIYSHGGSTSKLHALWEVGYEMWEDKSCFPVAAVTWCLGWRYGCMPTMAALPPFCCWKFPSNCPPQESLFFPPMPKEHLASRTWRCLALKVSILSREECYPRVRAPGTAGGSPRCAWLSGEPGTWAGCSGTLVGSGAPTERLFLPLTCLVGMPSSVYLIPSAIMTEQRGFS